MYIVSTVIDLVYILLPTQLPTCTYITILLPSIGKLRSSVEKKASTLRDLQKIKNSLFIPFKLH
jgi:hypothetical protein